jgi:hypothetical protein
MFVWFAAAGEVINRSFARSIQPIVLIRSARVASSSQGRAASLSSKSAQTVTRIFKVEICFASLKAFERAGRTDVVSYADTQHKNTNGSLWPLCVP